MGSGSHHVRHAGTRPDFADVVTALTQFNSALVSLNWMITQLRFPRGTTIGYKRTYGVSPAANPPSLNLHGYIDSDWGSNLDDRRSVTGYFFILGGDAVDLELTHP